MGPAPHGSRSNRVLALVILALAGSGCSSWQALKVSERPVVEPSASPKSLKLRKSDGKKLTLESWKLEGDTLRGTHEVWVDYEATQQPIAFALSEVTLRDGGLQGESLRRELDAREAAAAAAASRDTVVRASEPRRELPKKVRVMLTDGRTFMLEHAVVDGDSLRGGFIPEIPTDTSRPQVTFSLKDVHSIEAHEANTLGTVALVALGCAIVLGILTAEAFSNMR